MTCMMYYLSYAVWCITSLVGYNKWQLACIEHTTMYIKSHESSLPFRHRLVGSSRNYITSHAETSSINFRINFLDPFESYRLINALDYLRFSSPKKLIVELFVFFINAILKIYLDNNSFSNSFIVLRKCSEL